MKNGASFDNLDDLCAGPELETMPGADTPGMAKRRQKQAEVFIKFPKKILAGKLADTKLRATWPVILCLLDLSWKRESATVTLSNEVLKEWGVSRWRKSEALKELEAKKLVRVESAGKKAPRVTLLF